MTEIRIESPCHGAPVLDATLRLQTGEIVGTCPWCNQRFTAQLTRLVTDAADPPPMHARRS